MPTTWDNVELLVDAKAAVGEGPVWDGEQGVLLWIDIPAKLLHTFDPRTGADSSVEMADVVGAFASRPGGGLVAAVQDGYALLDRDTGAVEMIAEVEKGAEPLTRMNDGKCDSAGRFWAGTMAYDVTPGAGGFYRLDPDRTVHTILDEVTLSNGLGWSPDDRTMYYIDTMAGGVDVFDFDAASGAASNRRRLIDIAESDGLPDGMTVDAEGYLWVALFNGGCVRRYAPDGTLDGVVEMPVKTVTCPAFGGDDLSDLYITTAANAMEPSDEPGAGALFRCRVGIKGMPPFPFSG